MMAQLQIDIFTESRFPVDRKKIRNAARVVFEQSKVRGKINVEICIVGNRKMRQLNKKYAGIDSSTPVLTFALEDPHQACQRINILEKTAGNRSVTASHFVRPPDGILRLGSVVVSFPMARSLAAEEQMLVDEKINQLVEHGIKILLGKAD